MSTTPNARCARASPSSRPCPSSTPPPARRWASGSGSPPALWSSATYSEPARRRSRRSSEKPPTLRPRLQALAAPGAVVIASGTRDLTGGLFEYRDLGTVALKGFDREVRAWQALGSDAAESRFEALRGAGTPLVGRDDETSLLLRRWEQARAGEGHVVLLSGEAGVGKSRMTQVLLERSAQEPHARLRYFCSPHHQDSALHPLIAQLNHAAGIRRADADAARLAKLEAVIAQATDSPGEALPLLADLLGIPPGDRHPVIDLPPPMRKARTLEAPLTLIEAMAARRPVLMIFEDVHWSDPTTRALLDLLVDRLAALRVLLVVTFRPEFAPPWRDRPHVDLIGLGRLPPDQCAAIIPTSRAVGFCRGRSPARSWTAPTAFRCSSRS